jgi:hypothetical protein
MIWNESNGDKTLKNMHWCVFYYKDSYFGHGSLNIYFHKNIMQHFLKS